MQKAHYTEDESSYKTGWLYTNGKCPCCGAMIWLYYENEWKYGSPIRKCNKCGGYYVDKRYHEISIEGIVPNTLSLKHDMLRLLVFTGIFLIMFIFHIYEINNNGYYHLMPCGIMAISLICTIFTVIDSILIATGIKGRKLEKLKMESSNRLKDCNYVKELISLGYNVPEEYL